jgi:hypothetical protein
MGGMRITPALTLGRVAGRKIALEEFETTDHLQESGQYLPGNALRVAVIDD